jgi:hypothetical protein
MEDASPQGRPAAGGKPGHETTQIGVRGLVIFSVALIGVIAAAQIVLGLWMRSFARKEARVDALYPGRIAIEVDQFPNPRLQQNPRSELDVMKDEEDRQIRSYGWVDPKAGIARIPIERAMDILAQKGLPKVPAPAAVPGAPPNTSIPPARKREEPGKELDRGPPPAKPGEPRPESRQGGKP